MLEIKKKYIVNENDKKIAVQLDIPTFNMIEDLLENYVLVKLIGKNKKSDRLSINQAIKYYSKLKKTD